MDLRADELTAILAFLREAGAPCGLEQLPAQICSALSRLIPCLSAGYGSADPVTEAIHVSLDHPDLHYSPADLAYLATHLDELPFIDLPQCVEAHRSGLPHAQGALARKSSDYRSHRQFRELGVYNEVFRSKSIEYLLVLPTFRLGSHWIGGFGLQRDTRDFSERDRAVLTVIQPHLLRFFEHAVLLDILGRGMARDTCTVMLDSSGHPTLASEEAARWFHDVSGKAQALHLPERLVDYVRRHRTAIAPVPPLQFRRGNTTLTARFVPSAAGGDAGVLFLRRTCAATNGDIKLSPREAEVLRWVAEGKSNIDIAQILGCSAFTIRNHLQRIFEKLGVESRTAASAWWHGQATAVSHP